MYHYSQIDSIDIALTVSKYFLILFITQFDTQKTVTKEYVEIHAKYFIIKHLLAESIPIVHIHKFFLMSVRLK